ncbi:MAG: 2-hydroxychromene-2-carboxylate isomerase [Paracoccaceae bacterium]
MLNADLYYSFRSPYSDLGSGRSRELTRTDDLAIRLCPVYPAAIRDRGFFKARNPLFSAYLMRDVGRVADMTGVPCKRPVPDPIQFDAPGEASEVQPYIHRLTYLALEAERRGHGLDFACEVGKMMWGDHVENWHLPENLGPAIARAGLDLTELEAAIAGRDPELDAEVKANQTAEETAGHWGAPCLVFDGEPFFGQDRIDMAVWWMQQRGLKRRA